MTELGALLSRHLRELLRGRMTRAVLVLFLLGLLASAYVGAQSERGTGLMILSALLVVAMLAGGAAIGAGSALPEDRVAGREEWLATLAPGAWKRRLAAVLAGWLLAVAVGVVGGLVAGLAVAWVRPEAGLRTQQTVAVPPGAAIARAPDPTRAGLPLTLPLPTASARGTRTLDVDVRPLFVAPGGRPDPVLVDRARILWQAGPARGAVEVSVRGPIRIELPAAATSITLASRTPRVSLRVVAARLLESPRSLVASMGLTGLVIGILLGCAAPVAVLVSRRTSGQVAAAAAFCLLLFGAAKEGLRAITADLAWEGLDALAPSVIGTASYLAPDLPLAPLLGEMAALRLPAATFLSLLSPALGYTLAALLLAIVPAPRALRGGGGA